MLLDKFSTVLSASNREDLTKAVIEFTRELGFETMTAMVVVDSPTRSPEFRFIDNTPAGYRECFNDLSMGHRDPVMQHCKCSGLPIVWTQDTYVAANRGEKWEVQARFGYRTGIAVALHLPRGLHFLLGLDRDQVLPTDSAEITRVVSEFQLFAVLAHEPALRVLLCESMQPVGVRPLTHRELETLRWTMEGKTAWEVGRILSISEQTAVRHVNNATHKLGCINKHQAVLKAFRLGFIR